MTIKPIIPAATFTLGVLAGAGGMLWLWWYEFNRERN